MDTACPPQPEEYAPRAMGSVTPESPMSLALAPSPIAMPSQAITLV